MWRTVLFPAVALGLAACSPEPEIETRVVTVHTPATCAVPASGYALYYGLGDFQPSGASPAFERRFLSDVGTPMALLPLETRQLVLDVSAGDARFLGVTLVPERGPVDVLAWPAGRPCALSGAVGGLSRTQAQLTVSGPFAVVLGGTETLRVPESFVADLRTGRVEPLTQDLLTPRQRASAAAIRGGVLVTGGVRAEGGLVDSAERLVLADDRKAFDRAIIALGTPRADHASVTLASGEVLLVGGTSTGGTTLASLQAVDPSGSVRSVGLASLAQARRSPRALRLVSGEVLVFGGFDSAGAPVRTLEWLSADATRALRPPREIDVGVSQGAAALPAGGALIVTIFGAPMPRTSVLVISPSGEIEAAESVPGNVSQVSLFEAGAGAPVLWTGERWLRWRPWEGTFAPLAVDAVGPSAGAALASGDPGLLLWTETGRMLGTRFDVRGPFSTELHPLLRDDPGPLTPDRLVSASTIASMRFELAQGLSLPEGASTFLADATFANVDVTLTMTEGALPRFVLRAESGEATEVGVGSCPMPPGNPVLLSRRAARVELRDADGKGGVCQFPALANARVSVGLRGAGPGTAIVRELNVERRP